LLVLRIVAGATLVGEGTFCLFLRGHANGIQFFAAVLLLATGASILIGFLTPVLAPLAGLECLSIAFSWLPVPVLGLFDSKLVATQVIAMFAAVALLGPGAYSLDARLFGWKEIVIPAPPHKPD
jgi:uncharacterized membrane protein YphA (DoxX/SURF4 family)